MGLEFTKTSQMQTISAPQLQRNYRIQSIDLLRGLIMIIMALDHTRDYFHWSVFHYDPLDLTKTSTPIFLTRWITHFCAPVFVFLAGTSAWLTGVRKGKRALSKFLLTRGLWLIFIEITVMTFGITFNIEFSVILLLTLWALGISMIFLSVLVFLPKRVLLVLALAVIAFHNLLNDIQVEGSGLDAVGWAMLHEPKFFALEAFNIFIGYPVLPWIAVMAAGYCFGELYTGLDPVKRKRILIIVGITMIFLFIVIRWINGYGDTGKWSSQNNNVFTILSFINTTKYPPSLLYILMTLGPAILLLAFIEKPLNRFGKAIAIYGKVPFFYYILHFYLIHIAAVFATLLSGFSWNDITNSIDKGRPLEGYGFKLWIVYIVWFTIVALLYPLCKWYSNYKLRNPQKWWLSYL